MIGYYAHHMGAGHVTQALAIARHLRTPLTILSSREPPPDWDGPWLTLPRDDDADEPPQDATAGGTLHWAPARHPGLRRRMAALAAWIERARPRLIVSDVSVEVAAFARLLGIPVVTMALPGARGDAPHQLGYRLSQRVLAPWPAWAAPLSPAPERLVHVGAISRFDGRVPRPATNERRVLVLLGRGGADVKVSDLAAARAATPGWDWEAIGPPLGPWCEDPWDALQRASVVVCHAGQNAVAEVAAARRPAVVVPQARPHGEQRATAAALDAAGLALVADRWPAPELWPDVLAAAVRLDAGRWAAWCDGGGARRAAAVLDALAGAGPPVAPVPAGVA